jgi:hypothetical protein
MSEFSSPVPERPSPGHPPELEQAGSADEKVFLELRRKVQESELLAAATERLLHRIKFNGRITVVVHNGRIFKSAYQEGYFRRKNDLSCP